MTTERYRQFIPSLDIAIERNTEQVPQDNKYYLVIGGKIVAAFRSLKKAQAAFQEAVRATGYTPERPETTPRAASEQAIERYLDAKELYWAESYKYRTKGGKGGRGGV